MVKGKRKVLISILAAIGVIALLLAGPDLLDELTVSVCFMFLLSPDMLPAAGDFQTSAE